ncbi:MAG: leucyl/phenylalanyl-tRNA--protein transferase [Cycloclasticus sp. symbiont of Poecilosclerida sp. N]|nr:MAG: leucyl/phenylalanyl-tRNA--protein transferase [Cycloclasticus sp. symbiont of Poecilosclerida sp. N]
MLPWLDLDDDTTPFPELSTALDNPNGLLAAGGSLKPARLLNAYRRGIFPWFEDGQPILWWSPDPRMVLSPAEFRVSRSLKKAISKNLFNCTFDTAFSEVISACSEPREGQDGTWITSSMIQAYEALFERGDAHSIEVWSGDTLAGGLYGVGVGQVFFGESMFSRESNASKIGFIFLCESLANWGYQLIDCQVQSKHLAALGAETISRDDFTSRLDVFCDQKTLNNSWSSLSVEK